MANSSQLPKVIGSRRAGVPVQSLEALLPVLQDQYLGVISLVNQESVDTENTILQRMDILEKLNRIIDVYSTVATLVGLTFVLAQPFAEFLKGETFRFIFHIFNSDLVTDKIFLIIEVPLLYTRSSKLFW